MADQTIKCPNCGATIPLTEALTGQIEKTIRAKYEVDAAQKTAELEKEKQALAKQQKELEAQRQSFDEKVAEQVKAERKKIADEKKSLEAQRQEIEDKIAEQVKAERKKIVEQEKAKILAEQAEQTKALEEELTEQRKKVKEANAKELEFLKKQRQLEEKTETLELEVERKVAAERKRITEEAGKKAAEEQMLKMREKNDQLAAMKKQIDELKRKAEVGSQEAQGEALEEELQEYLERTFPYDRFEEVKKGARGADILQIVHNQTGKECGRILWESKNTKEFSNKWIEKIKTDQQQASADIAAIMSIALPKEINNFGVYNGVWVADYKSAIGLCTAFRETLIRVERERVVTQHQDSLKDVVYKYITGQEFTMRVKRIADAYIAMQRDLESEKRAMNRIWNKREKQITTVLDNLTAMRGEIEGVVGGQKALPSMESLSLEGIAEKEAG